MTPDDLPLSFAQQRMWFLTQLEGLSQAYHIPFGLHLHGPLDVLAWRHSLNALFARHEALRSVFVSIDGVPHVELLAPDEGITLLEHDLREAPDAQEQLERLCAAEATASFDLGCGPLIRACLVRLSDQDHVFLLVQHHILSDGWSMGIFVRELSALYAAFRQGQPDPLPPLAIQYPDYAVWQRRYLTGERIQAHSQYWREALAGAPDLLELPSDRPRPAEQSFQGAGVTVHLDAELTAALKRLSQRHGITLFMTLVAAWAAVLTRLSGQHEVVIGSPSANRNRPEIEPLIGLFVNTLALRIDLAGEPRVAELLRRVRDTVLAAQDHQELPFEQVVELIQPARRVDRTPLFQVLFAWQNNLADSFTLADLEVSPTPLPFNPIRFDLELELGEAHGEISGVLRYATAMFDTPTIERHVDYLRRALRAMIVDSQQPVASLPLLGEEERTLLLETWNRTEPALAEHACIHQLFEQQVERCPEATALVYEQLSLSYRELNAQANRLAHHLIALGVKPDDRVALCLESSTAMVIGLLAILKAGGAYVPLDPTYPSERLIKILSEADPRIVLSDTTGRRALNEHALEPLTVLDLGASPAPWVHLPDTNPEPNSIGLTSHQLAYVIYTSGSTGSPKGVMVEHAQITRLLRATEYIYHFDSQDVWCLFHSVAFDFSVWELWGALCYGGRLIVVPYEIRRSGQYFYRLVCEHGITVLNQTPSSFQAFIDAHGRIGLPSRLRYVIFGGEALNPSMLKLWYASHSDQQPQLVNMYGITETTVHVTFKILADTEQSGSVIGRRLPDVRIYLLDAHGEPVPLGAVGELYIGGAGVARGYLNRPELTAERFLPDPFSPHPGARMYRSGDLARYRPDGNLEFLGRNDHQVKIRGFRIEPGEIEAHLTSHPAVREAVVLARESSPGERRLVAYLTTVAQQDSASSESLAATLRAYLSARLPEYMLPAAFVHLDAFPLTPNGKLDRKALPAPDSDAYAHQVYEAPQGRIEQTLAALWEELLGVSQVGRHDNFFEVGGHSLLAIQLMERLRRLGLSTEIRTLFATRTLAELAATLGSHQDVPVPPNLITAETTALTPQLLPLIQLTQGEIDHIVAQVPGGLANIQDIYSLSPLQDGILFHHLLAAQGDPYLLIVQTAFPDRALLDRYLHALQQVVDRHDILRTAFLWQQLSTPAQVVLRHAPLVITEVALDPHGGPAHEQLARRFDPRHFRINLSQAPLLHLIIAQEPAMGRWLLVQLLHHLIGDHSALETLASEVRCSLNGQSHALPEPKPFRDLVAQARLGTSQQEHERYFQGLLADIDEPTAPFGLIDVYRDGDQVDQATLMLPQTLNDQLRAHARRLNVSLASLCHLAWGQVIGRTSGRDRVVFGTVLLGRLRAGSDADRAMGLFINTLPLRLDLDDSGVEDSVRRTHTRLAELLQHEHASLALAQRCSGVRAPAPLFSSLLNYRHNRMPSAEESPLEDPLHGVEWLSSEERTNYPLTLSVEDFGHSLGLTAQVLSPLSPERICRYMQQALEQLAHALTHAPHTPVRQLDVMPADERALLLESCNRTDTPYPQHLCIQQLFEQQVERCPEATALVYEQLSLSYRELNAQANRLAHHLIALGVKPDDRIGLCLERGPAMVIGLLAILKAGGAYVPLDPDYPSTRLLQMLEDAAPRLLLSSAASRSALGQSLPAQLRILDLDATPAPWAHLPDTNPDPDALGLASSHLAYVIYTSGSTGTPKGVMIEHRGVINLAQAQISLFGVAAHSRVVQFASINFDTSVSELAMALGSGACLCLPTQEQRQGHNLLQYLACADITHATLPPALLTELGELSGLRSLQTLILAGEAPNSSLFRSLTGIRLFNAYGPTEGTVCASAWASPAEQFQGSTVPIGRPIANVRIYLLDAHGEPVPLGTVGELYIGGAGVARGYLNRPELTAERFLPDPFSPHPGARMYRSGDLARYRPDGNLEFLGRNDHQVKIRGFRIEPGEIEAHLASHAEVKEALVVATEGLSREKRLVGYVVPRDPSASPTAASLHQHLKRRLPDYMLPSAFMTLAAFPLTPNGKLDRKALPAPDSDAYAHQVYEAPQGRIEQTLAALWEELLGVSQVGRHDNFFELGGHSLLAVQLMERLRRLGLSTEIRTLFATRTLAELAATLGSHQDVPVPPNLITAETTALTPQLLPLIQLTQGEIDHIVAQVPGGLANIQDIYSLSPLQDGILFHHLLATQGDPYLLVVQITFPDRDLLDRYVQAMQGIVDRHDILRTAFLWQQLSTPAQVVLRHAPLVITEVALDPHGGPAHEQLARRFDPRHFRINLSQAPLLHLIIAQEPDTGRWLLVQLLHHLAGDHSTLETLPSEVRCFLNGQSHALPEPKPFRDLVAQARLGTSQQEHERYFQGLLADIDEPTAPFGLIDVYRDGDQVDQATLMLPQTLNDQLRAHARRLNVSLASLCHLAWGQVIGRTSGRDRVVFGTVLLGRLRAGSDADRAMGLFINTLPLRLDLDDSGVEDSVRRTHTRLAELLQHEHASLALAQRCSGVRAPAPLFSSLLNYRHNRMPSAEESPLEDPLHGVEWLSSEERTNYPLTLSVEDFGHSLGLTAQVLSPLSPERICRYMQQALEQLAHALTHAPHTPVRQLDVMPADERALLLESCNRTDTPYPQHLCIQQLFEQQVERCPEATALVYEQLSLSYRELNAQANRLAHHLIALGVKPDDRIGLCLERGPAMVIGLLAILKAGGAYVPLDPDYPSTRLLQMLEDAAPRLLLSSAASRSALGQSLPAQLRILDLDVAPAPWAHLPDTNPDPDALGLASSHLAYVIYTSGSTGTPKGVAVQHRAVVNFLTCLPTSLGLTAADRLLAVTTIGFDIAGLEIYAPLLVGAVIVVASREAICDATKLIRMMEVHDITCMQATPATWQLLLGSGWTGRMKLKALCGGEALSIDLSRRLLDRVACLWNLYGPTETTVWSSVHEVSQPAAGAPYEPIGRPIRNTTIYLLDGRLQLVPHGAVGEIYIGGAGLARGYLNRPELTAERFLPNPFSGEPRSRLYKTGDLARWRPDGTIDYLGRNDQQVKIRGFRIELGEIQAHLANHAEVKEALVVATEGPSREKRLVGYVVPADPGAPPTAASLREHLKRLLPDYMLPSAFVTLAAFPLTPNGKLDRKALPSPEAEAYARQLYEAPQGETEHALASLWEELLGVPQVSRNDNFFELGGHSLLAMQLVESIHIRLGVGIPLTEVFAHATLTEIAALITSTVTTSGQLI